MCLKNIKKLFDIEVKKRRNVVKVEKPKIFTALSGIWSNNHILNESYT